MNITDFAVKNPLLTTILSTSGILKWLKFANNLLFPQVSLISCGREVLCGHYFHALCLLATCSHMQAMGIDKLIKEVLQMTNDDTVQYYASKGL